MNESREGQREDGESQRIHSHAWAYHSEIHQLRAHVLIVMKQKITNHRSQKLRKAKVARPVQCPSLCPYLEMSYSNVKTIDREGNLERSQWKIDTLHTEVQRCDLLHFSSETL